MPSPPRPIESLVVQTDSYDPASAFAHTRATIVAASSATAPPVSLLR
jgi:hypothetical protein